jgi:biopolymer transport protein TolR
MRTNKREGKGIYEVNMTPLIDVSLVLVVILMVATPMALQSSIALQKPGQDGVAARDPLPRRIEIRVASEDSVVVDGTSMARAMMPGALRGLMSAHSTHEVLVRWEKGVTHGTFVGVLDDAKQCGAENIAVVGR